MSAAARGPTLRRRLLAAFLVLTALPLAALSVAVLGRLERSLDLAASRRLDSALQGVARRLERLRERAEEQVAEIVKEDLAAFSDDTDDVGFADAAGRRRELSALEILDAQGHIVSSRQWPVGFGLPDRDRTFPGGPGWRLETVAEGYGETQQLALVAERRGRLRGRPVTVRGGTLLDAEWLGGLAALTGSSLGLYDSERGRWLAPSTAPLDVWEHPGLEAGRGRTVLRAQPFRWAAHSLAPTLLLVVAAPGDPLEQTLAELRRLILVAAAATLAAALAAALILSTRLTRPLLELSEGARRIAAGDLAISVPEADGELGELARAFNEMAAELRASRARVALAERVAAGKEMARRLAHELKKPLFPIQLCVETLRRAGERGAGGADPALAHLLAESTETILHELRSLNRVLDAFTDFARLPRPRLEPTDLARVAASVLALYQARAAGVTLEPSLAPLPPVPADPDLLVRALGNLVANAIEAMPDGGQLRLRTLATPEAVAVEVEDTGPGLDEEQRSRLFTPYHTTKPGGSGLGLVIAQSIAADHGGRVDVSSEPGRGACFALVLPRPTS